VIEMLSPTPADSSRDAAATDNTPAAQAGRSSSWRRYLPPPRLAALGAVLAVLGWSYAPNLRSLVATWNHDPNYSHGFLVIPIALYILWRRWIESDGDAKSSAIKPWLPALVMLAGVLALRAYLYESGLEWSETATILPTIACLVLLAGGWSLVRIAWPALAFLIFMLPLPQSVNGILSLPLQKLATAGCCVLLKLTGLWVMSEGNVIYVGANPLEVAAACNGLSMLMCLAATVAAMTMLVPMPSWKRIVLLASIVPIALISNILRITATAWCYSLLGADKGAHFAHDAAGWLMMPMALLLVSLELALLSWMIVTVEELPASRPDRLQRRHAV
jgi:exosortase